MVLAFASTCSLAWHVCVREKSHPKERMAVNLERPLQKLVRTLQQPPAGHHSRVVDQYGDISDLRPHPVRRLVNALPTRKVNRVGAHPSTQLLHQLGGLLVSGSVAVPQHQVRALFGELQGEQATQRAPGSRDQAQLAIDALQPRPEESLDDGADGGVG